MSNFLEKFAIKVVQPLGELYLTKFSARELLEISFAEELRYKNEKGELEGNQRKQDKERLKSITRYIDSVEMAFPNSIILCANYTEDGAVLEEPEEAEDTSIDDVRWRLERQTDDIYKIIIPTNRKLASVVDGQHRVWAFENASMHSKNIELPCAVYFDLPNSYQAYLFATINGNQKPVNRSLALEQFGFNVADEPEKSWTPEKLAVYLSRRLNAREDSPFSHRIKVAPRDPYNYFKNREGWYVSMATVVDGILSLITNKPKRDRVEMAYERIFAGRSRKMVENIKDSSPLRQWYLDGRDEEIYSVVKDFFSVASEILWVRAKENSYIIKTVGILALFDLLKQILQRNIDEKNFEKYVRPVENVDFSDSIFQASGVGRSRIRATLFIANGFEVRSTNETKASISRLLDAD